MDFLWFRVSKSSDRRYTDMWVCCLHSEHNEGRPALLPDACRGRHFGCLHRILSMHSTNRSEFSLSARSLPATMQSTQRAKMPKMVPSLEQHSAAWRQKCKQFANM